MGCVTSKQKEYRLCNKCQGSCSPPLPRRSYSLHRHSPTVSHEVHHLVSLTSSSLEPLKNESFRKTEYRITPCNDGVEGCSIDEERVGLIEAKMWSRMIDERIPKIVPKTPIRTPPGEPENINAWELMEGLEDISPLRPVNYLRSFSFHLGSNLNRDERGETEEMFSKPKWLELADNENGLKSLEFDPNVISTFREALDLPNEKVSKTEGNFEEEISVKNVTSVENLEKVENDVILGIGEKDRGEFAFEEEKMILEEKVTIKNRVVLYFTSLRGVRKTYEDCCHVRMILKSIGVKIDERDVSMHSGFKEELKELLGNEFSTSPLPRVFFGENYIGGADEITQMHEDGRLEKMLIDGGDMADDMVGVCEACGDVRFVPCERCYGSCKIYYGDEYENDYEDDEYEAKEFDGFQRCPDCNENGLVRCPICCG